MLCTLYNFSNHPLHYFQKNSIHNFMPIFVTLTVEEYGSILYFFQCTIKLGLNTLLLYSSTKLPKAKRNLLSGRILQFML